MKTLERLTVFTKDQCLGHESNLTVICVKGSRNGRMGKGKEQSNIEKKESKEKGIDLTVCNTLAFQSVR